MKNFYLLHFKECPHGDSWPCVQPEGYLSCGNNGWTIGEKNGQSYYIIGSDYPQYANEFDSINPLYMDPFQRAMTEEIPG